MIAAVIIDLQTGEFIDLNPEAELLLGRSRQELLAGREVPQFRSLSRLVTMRRQRAERLEAELVRPDGLYLPVIITAYPIDFPGKEAVLNLFGEETSGAAGQQKELFASAMGRKGAGLALIDRQMRVVWVNEQHERWVGPLAELKGRYCYEAFEALEAVCPNCPVAKTFASGEESWAVRYNTNPRLEAEGFFLLRTAPILDSQGKVDKVLELVQRIEEPQFPEKAMELSALQHLSSRLATDFGVALASLMGSSPLALVQIEPRETH